MKNLRLVDLMRLVATDAEPHKVLEKAYDWEHSRWLEIGKWFLATGTAALIGAITLMAKQEPAPVLHLATLGAAGVLAVMIGLGAFWRVRFISSRYSRVRAICGELMEVRSFLQLLRQSGML